jgi:hypothetical protein
LALLLCSTAALLNAPLLLPVSATATPFGSGQSGHCGDDGEAND